jgi:hypothetical protein
VHRGAGVGLGATRGDEGGVERAQALGKRGGFGLGGNECFALPGIAHDQLALLAFQFGAAAGQIGLLACQQRFLIAGRSDLAAQAAPALVGASDLGA